MKWLTRFFKRDDKLADDLKTAADQRRDAHQQLAESRDIVAQTRSRMSRNHITEGFAAAFERRHQA